VKLNHRYDLKQNSQINDISNKQPSIECSLTDASKMIYQDNFVDNVETDEEIDEILAEQVEDDLVDQW